VPDYSKRIVWRQNTNGAKRTGWYQENRLMPKELSAPKELVGAKALTGKVHPIVIKVPHLVPNCLS